MKSIFTRAFATVAAVALVAVVIPMTAAALDDSALQAAELGDALAAGQAEDNAQTQAGSVIASGTWGTCPWEISDTGVLTVHPGVLAGTISESPWISYSSAITHIVFKEEAGAKIVPGEHDSLNMLFYNLSSVKTMDLSGLDTSTATEASCMFEYCSALERLDLSSFDTSQIWDMRFMFSGCSSLRYLDLSSFTDNEDFFTYTQFMFLDCDSLATLKLGDGFTCLDSLPSDDVYGVHDWYSSQAKQWFTSNEITSTRLGISDTYT